MNRCFFTFFAVFFCGNLAVNSQNATFTFSTTNGTPAIDSALNRTGEIWGAYLQSDVPIKINIYYINLFVNTTLAVTIPNGRKDFSAAPFDSVWYPTSLANSLQGAELNPGEADMDIYVNNSVNWYFGLDGNPPAGKHDFITVMLHEIGHGLGFLALVKEEDTLGSIGTIGPADLVPLTTSFPFPILEGKHSIFTYFMQDGSGQLLTNPVLFPNPSVELLDAFTSNAMYFNGALATAVNNGNPVRLYAPSAFASGSSLQHLNESTYPPANPNTLMTPFLSSGEVHHQPGPLTIAILEDIGWNVNHNVGVDENAQNSQLSVFPNPANGTVYLRSGYSAQYEDVTIVDLSGRVVYNQKLSLVSGEVQPLDITEFTSGTYFVKLRNEVRKLIIY